MNSDNKKYGGIILAAEINLLTGKDKGLIEFWGKKLIDYSIDLLRPFCAEIKVSTNQSSYNITGLKLVPVVEQEKGLLASLCSALKSSEYTWNIVVKCDMPFLHPELIDQLLSETEDCDLIFPSHENGFEPFVGLYKKELAGYFEECIRENELDFLKVIKKCKVKFVDSESLLYKYPLLFQNFSAQGDIMNV